MKKIKNAVALLILSAMTIPTSALSASASGSDNKGLEGSQDNGLGVVVTPRVIGGQEALDNAWPSMVALVRNSNQSLFFRQFCGANQISERWAVTAAHCLFDTFDMPIDISTIRVAVGFTDLADESSATELVVTNVIVHPQYSVGDASSPHDLALVEFANRSQQPSMPLYVGDANDQAGMNAVVAGWGSNDYSNPSQPLFPSRLNQVGVPIVSREVCNMPDSYDGLIGEGQICAGFRQGGKDSCVGDSGGPLMGLQNGVYRQIGVVSYGRGCAEPNFYGVYTRLDYYRTWISEITSIDTSGDGSNGSNNTGSKATSPLVPSSTSTKAGGGGSLGPLLPFFMMLLAIWALRRGMADTALESEE